jgi:hypothetical protein
MRALAETVWRLVRRDKSQTAVHLISKVLSELDLTQKEPPPQSREQRAYLLNLRGVIYAQKGQEDSALADLEAAHREMPHWSVPLYNLGLCHKQAHRWPLASDVLSRALQCIRRQAGRFTSNSVLAGGSGLSRAVLWNLGIAQTAQGSAAEAKDTWQACGVTLPRGGSGDLGLAQLSLPTQGPYSIERVWVQRLDPVRARILSVVRYGAPCQFGDVVLCDSPSQQSNFCDGLINNDNEDTDSEENTSGLIFLQSLDSAGYVLHVVHGGPATPGQAMTLTERMREAGLHIEVWSLTMRLPGSAPPAADAAPEERGAPLCAGLVLPTGAGGGATTRWPDTEGALHNLDAQVIAEKAVTTMSATSRELSLALYSPTLMTAAGDELGAARHRKALRRGAFN